MQSGLEMESRGWGGNREADPQLRLGRMSGVWKPDRGLGSGTWAGVAITPPVTGDRPEEGFQAPVLAAGRLRW